MKRALALGAVVAVFLVGMAGGMAGAHLFYARKLESTSSRVPFLAPHYMGRLEENLDLTPEQSRQVGRILEGAHREAESLRRDVRSRLQRLMEKAHGDIRDVLTPEQRQRFDELPIHQRRWHEPSSHRHRRWEKPERPFGVSPENRRERLPGEPPWGPPGPPPPDGDDFAPSKDNETR
ncbi:MAG: hypothetical protein KDD47_22475 [Acidobacteria bacterium]|nr:hypothetical protein [Acidobacteriota bacterium]